MTSLLILSDFVRFVGSGASNIDKRDGIRVIYYFYNENNLIYLLFAYSENVQTDLSEYEKIVTLICSSTQKNLFTIRRIQAMENEKISFLASGIMQGLQEAIIDAKGEPVNGIKNLLFIAFNLKSFASYKCLK